MNDADIIKSFELCFSQKGTAYTCRKCPYHKYGKLCKVESRRDALDLMKRYKEVSETGKKKRTYIKICGVKLKGMHKQPKPKQSKNLRRG